MADASDNAIVDVGVAGLKLPGQLESGDLEIVETISHGMLLGVVDGLGHGADAAIAAKEAVKTMISAPDKSVISLVKSCHEALRNTRGATMSLAVLHNDDDTMTWLGIGNVEGHLLRANPHSTPPPESLLLRSGVVGYILPPLHVTPLPLVKGDLLVFASDGIRSGFAGSIPSGRDITAQEIAEHLCRHHAKGTDDALVLVAHYKGNRL